MLFWAFLLKKLKFWRIYNSTYNELSYLDDRTLADINIHRSSIRSVARSAALKAAA